MNSDTHRFGQDNPDEIEATESRRMEGYFVQIPAQRTEGRLDLRLLWEKLTSYKLMIGLIILIPVVLSAIVVTMIQPVYRSEVLLAPAATDGGNVSALASQFGGLASLAGVNASSGSSKDHAIAVLKSRGFTEEFIKNENLLPILFADEWDQVEGKWRSTEETDFPTIADAFRLFDERIRTVNDMASVNMVTLRIEWTDRELAAKWATLLVERLNEDVRGRDIEEAQRSIEFLNLELQKNGVVELRQGIFTLLQQQIEKIMIANVRPGYAFKVLDPAFVADVDQYVYPRKIAFVLAAAILGLFLAVVAAMVRSAWTDPAHS